MEKEAGRKPEENTAEGRASHVASPTGALARIGWVSLALVVCSLIVAPIAYTVYGKQGLLAATLAAVVCLLAAALSSLVSSLLQSAGSAVSGLLLAMLIRMGLPLAVCLVVYAQDGAMAQAGFGICLLVYYPVALAIETWSDVGVISRSHTISGRA